MLQHLQHFEPFLQILTNTNYSWLHLCKLSGSSVTGKRPAMDACVDPCGCLGPPWSRWAQALLTLWDNQHSPNCHREGQEGEEGHREGEAWGHKELRHPDCRQHSLAKMSNGFGAHCAFPWMQRSCAVDLSSHGNGDLRKLYGVWSLGSSTGLQKVGQNYPNTTRQ